VCGIAGAWGTYLPDSDQANRCLWMMQYRGPDGQQFRKFQSSQGWHATLLHSRLEIIDLDPRANPKRLALMRRFSLPLDEAQRLIKEAEASGIHVFSPHI